MKTNFETAKIIKYAWNSFSATKIAYIKDGMIMKRVVVISTLLLFGTILSENVISDTPMTASVIIPCYWRHAQFLFDLLKVYEHQTELPDEVVISMSEVGKVKTSLIKMLQQERWLFPITLLISEEQLFAGENRNRACAHAKGDILICQDADDIPHPQRIEIIKHFFKTHKVDHLMHEWIAIGAHSAIDIKKYDLTQIDFAFPKNFQEAWLSATFTNGNVAIAQHVFEKVKWSSAHRRQDSAFNKEVYSSFNHCITLNVPLLLYRSFLSSIAPSAINFEAKNVNTQVLSSLTYSENQNEKAKRYAMSVITNA